MKKTIKFLLLISMIFFNISCSNFLSFNIHKLGTKEREVKIKSLYAGLSNDYYKLLEDEINNSEREKLLLKFRKLRTEILEVKNNERKNKNHIKFLDDYLKKIDLNIQYLEDLE